MKIKLREKVKLTDGTYSNEIEVREPTRADLKAIEHIEGNLNREDLMISRLTKISISALDQMVFTDSLKLQDLMSEMMGDSYDPKSTVS
ncbi:phage tail assembly protein [Thiotrichales bacterium 19X7-9]|nr:phage tail assembly protein [Thiotrichales bacterium 19X7-9]TNF65689.1 MAG: phage tail assembly protein [Gammaproteobacteria bacterium]UTW43175.1 phage tail assembly protein [bacterium SCSIO 12844]